MLSSKERVVLEILEFAKIEIENDSDLSRIDSGTKFENHVTMVIESIAKKYNVSVEQTGSQSFPDIIIHNTFGIEVKYTKSLKWESTGNSIFEGTFRKEVTDNIFTFFGRKVGKKIEIRYKNYEDTLANIKVTHSPRFYINMDIEKEETILETIGIKYADFKQLSDIEKSKKLKEFVKNTLEEGESLWWLDEEESISPKIKEFRSLQAHQKRNITIESMILFPEIFSKSSTKYLRLSVYLMQEYQIVSSSLRDAFSASGKEEVVVNNVSYTVPQIHKKFYEYVIEIENTLNNMEVEKLKEYWSFHKDMDKLNETNKFTIFKELLDELSQKLPNGLLPSHIFDEGIK